MSRRKKKHQAPASDQKVEIQMTPMLDMIFQLLVFFILTFRPVADEGQFEVTMSSVASDSIASASESMALDESENLPQIIVGLRADLTGRLAAGGITLGDQTIGSMPELQQQIDNLVQGRGADFEGIVEAETRLQYQYVMHAVNALSHAGVRQISFRDAPLP